MSHGIHFTHRSQRAASHQDAPAAPIDGEVSETPVAPQRGEHGAVYFDLDWQNQQAADRQQRTHETYQGENLPAIDQPVEGDEPIFDNFRQSNSETNSSRQSDSNYRQTNSETNPFGQTNSDQNNFQTARQNSSHSANNPNNNYANDSSNYANNRSARSYSSNSASFNQNDESLFNALQNLPQRVQTRIIQMSAPRLVEVEINGRIETRQISRFDELVQRMESLKLTPQEFARTLPREEREAFLARLQTTQTAADKSPNESKPLLQAENNGEKLFAQTSSQTKNDGNSAARNVEGNSPGTTLQNAPGKLADAPKNILTADKTFNAPTEANLKAASGAATFGAAENSNVFVLNHSRAENSLVANVLTRRETGEILGGALINNALAAVGEYERTENYRIGDACGNGKYFGAGALGFAAGATGALLSAAIGRVIPGAGTDVSGVLGFVSGVVVGVDINEGLRWLGASHSISGATIYESNLLSENSAAPNFNLQTRFA